MFAEGLSIFLFHLCFHYCSLHSVVLFGFTTSRNLHFCSHSCPYSKEKSLLQNWKPYQVDRTGSLVLIFKILSFSTFALVFKISCQIQFRSSLFPGLSLAKASARKIWVSLATVQVIVGRIWLRIRKTPNLGQITLTGPKHGMKAHLMDWQACRGCT